MEGNRSGQTATWQGGDSEKSKEMQSIGGSVLTTGWGGRKRRRKSYSLSYLFRKGHVRSHALISLCTKGDDSGKEKYSTSLKD